MIVRDGVKPLVFSEEGQTVEVKVRYSNRGDPWREGVEIVFDSGDWNKAPIWVLLDEREIRQLRDKLNEYLGDAPAAEAVQKLQTVAKEVVETIQAADKEYGTGDRTVEENEKVSELREVLDRIDKL